MLRFILFFFLGLICEFIDSHLGGGYGTIITPVALMIGYTPLEIVPCILITEIITGILSGLIYHQFGHVESKSSIIIFISASVGAIIGSSLLISISKFYVSLYIGILVTILGFIMLMHFRLREYSLKGTTFLGLLIGFNKALSGGGFGPILVAGLNILGLDPKKAVGTTSLTEGLVCIIALLLLLSRNIQILFSILFSLMFGAILGAIIGSLRTIRYENKTRLQHSVSIFIFVLGISLLLKLFLL